MIIGSNIIFIRNLPSTNSHAIQLVKNKSAQEGTIITTNFQSAGRGQPGNGWESEDGKNLLFSIILYPSMILPADQFVLSMAISLGICDFLSRYITDCSIKWPNDIYVNNDKIAGILIENTIMGSLIEQSVAGIGLNINQEKFLSNAPNPVSLKLITGEEYDIKLIMKELADDLDKRYKQVISENRDLIRREYISKLYNLNRYSDFRDKDGIFSGRILSVTNNGRLQLETKAGVKKDYQFKEISFIL